MNLNLVSNHFQSLMEIKIVCNFLETLVEALIFLLAGFVKNE